MGTFVAHHMSGSCRYSSRSCRPSTNERRPGCFWDNLSAQAPLWHKCNTKRHLEPAECTHEIAVVDPGVGKMCNNHMHRAYDEWVEKEDINDHTVNGQVIVSEKGILAMLGTTCVQRWIFN